MPKVKASVSLAPGTIAQARELFGDRPLSELLDEALRLLITAELDRRHAAGYARKPPEVAEDAWAEIERHAGDIADDVDWARLYGLVQP